MLRNLLVLFLATATPVAAQLAPGCSTVVAARDVSAFATVRAGPIQLAVPQEWLERELAECPTGIYTAPNQLDSLLALPVTGEWDPQYQAVLDASFRGDSLAGHFGSEQWPGGGRFSDLQMRVYLSAESPNEVLSRAGTLGRAAAESTGPMLNAPVRIGPMVMRGWTGLAIGMPVFFHDYGGTATVEILVRQCGARTAALVFMHESEWLRFDHSDLIRNVVQRSSCG